ncbi:MAG: WYL domain-containing protein [Bacteroidales bacterium]|nr:WYL domain-containing protein [Bacteroidales bacterium]
MKASALFKQYVWLVDTIRRAGRITLREINDRWLRTEMSEGVPFSRTTFRRHRAEVEEMFGIIIDCDSENQYYIDDPSLMNTDSVPRWMLSTLAVSNIVSEARGLHDRILLESIPSESEHLQLVIEAMRNSHRISVTYRRYGDENPSIWKVEPYCIKLFRRRWYLLGCFEKGGFITLSFDRIVDINVTDEDFKMDCNFDAQLFFNDYFGVMTDDRLPIERIVLRAYGSEPYYLRDLPLHPSQQEIETNKDYTDFEIRLRPTRDFFAHLLSRGRWLQVISPDSIAQEIKQMHLDATKNSKK